MPQLGQSDGNVGLGVVPLADARGAQVLTEFHRNKQRENMLIPEEPEPITELSVAQRVYIYNVGPWRFQQDLASYGSRTIPALAEESVFKGLSVAGPLVIAGIPSECYPAEGEAKRIYHRPLKNRGRQSSRPGYDFALEVIGCGMMVNPSCDLRPSGVFISEQMEPKQPVGKVSDEVITAWKKWESDVKTAQVALRKECSRICQEANMAYSRGKFADVRSDKIYQAARLINGNELQYAWLKDTGEKADNKTCFMCGTVIKGFALKCPQCGEAQVSEAELNAERERRAKQTL